MLKSSVEIRRKGLLASEPAPFRRDTFDQLPVVPAGSRLRSVLSVLPRSPCVVPTGEQCVPAYTKPHVVAQIYHNFLKVA